uniref:WGS project CBMG000000000 data, contig CS5907-c001770 n=1 Tax=Fusarium acuminatum CS5907 TaxID=1318461 RepID=A0A090M975_9HYPO|nr:unnamed protein product [Fusarium acuminatum CS5907]
MAAHLHRYKSELNRVESILCELQSAKFSIADQSSNPKSNMPQDSLKIDHLMSQLNAIRGFTDELERKFQNILALVILSSYNLKGHCMLTFCCLDAALQPNPGDERLNVAGYSYCGARRQQAVTKYRPSIP